MLTDFTGADRVIIACGRTDLRPGIDAYGCFSQIVYRGKEYSNFKIIKEAGIIKIID